MENVSTQVLSGGNTRDWSHKKQNKKDRSIAHLLSPLILICPYLKLLSSETQPN